MIRPKKIFLWVGLILYGLLLFLFLSLSRLPVDRILGKLFTLVTGTQAQVSAETVSFSWPMSYALEKVTWQIHWPQGVSKDHADSLVFGPEWSNVFSGSLPLKSEANFARGRVQARLGLPFLRRGYMEAKVFGIHLEDLSLLEILLGRRVSGKGQGELRLVGDFRSPPRMNGRGFLRATEGSVETKLPLAGLSLIPFKSVSATLVIQKGVLFLSDGHIEGPALSGSFSGEVKLDKPLGKSLVKITANVTPMPMLDENDFAREWLQILGDQGKPFTIRLGGPLEGPSIRLEKD